ncbi:YpdA family putative bacillithiol disulfide reductase [Evansella tamaricis]|uniref:YpdA family putative bacillithiol disulfide reductase n=1 Tax=Evansella tamaricis TaxID=2069301 RepID=A0ABS6JPM9_9BACI|nr:YpdA family putative bacillithiol disulfide reductase [Evansella tamaricis]MBU9714263.1 YpdA family putative bacillithiol disulfide reductase [Evansella tamaricis]
MKQEKVIIIGGGPCGLAAAIAIQRIGMDPLVIEKGNIVNALYNYPTHQQFFSTSEKLSIGDVPFYSTERKPKRNEALVYYRQVVKEKNIRINAFEKVIEVTKEDSGQFSVVAITLSGKKNHYKASYIIMATGYYDSPNMMGIKGEELPHVYHYFKEAHPFFDQHVAVIGGKNSAVDAALELEKAGAKVTVFYRGETYSPSIKPWILPEFESLVKHGKIEMHFGTNILEIKENTLIYEKNGDRNEKKADFVFAMTGYHPDHSFIQSMGVTIDSRSGRPTYDVSMETNVTNIFIAGVIAAGNNANEIFIENGRYHGDKIANIIKERG